MTGSNSHRSFTRWLLAGLLALGALPAFAQEASTTATVAATADAARPAAVESLSMSDRALMLASDINRLVGARADAGASPNRVQSVLSRALALLGTPYRWGGTSPEGGIELPRVSREMAKTGELVASKAQLVKGDLVFFGKSGTVDHVGIYVGDGKFVHAPRTGRDVTVSTLESGYWGAKFLQGRRVAGI
jgi:cell wall-associated NlpC family hydrolase